METKTISIRIKNLRYPYEKESYIIDLPPRNPYNPGSQARSIITGSLKGVKGCLKEEFGETQEYRPRVMMFWGIPEENRLSRDQRREIIMYLRYEIKAI